MAAFHAAQAHIFERQDEVPRTACGRAWHLRPTGEGRSGPRASLGQPLGRVLQVQEAADYAPNGDQSAAEAEAAIAGARSSSGASRPRSARDHPARLRWRRRSFAHIPSRQLAEEPSHAQPGPVARRARPAGAGGAGGDLVRRRRAGRPVPCRPLGARAPGLPAGGPAHPRGRERPADRRSRRRRLGDRGRGQGRRGHVRGHGRGPGAAAAGGGHRRARAGRDPRPEQPAARATGPGRGPSPTLRAGGTSRRAGRAHRHRPLRQPRRRAPGGRPPGRARHHACRRHPARRPGARRSRAGRRLLGLPHRPVRVGLRTATRSRRACGAAACC